MGRGDGKAAAAQISRLSDADLQRLPAEEQEQLQQELVSGLTRTPVHRFLARRMLRNDPDALAALAKKK